MTAADRVGSWADARTLDDLCWLTAGWLEGTVGTHPLYLGSPDRETGPLVPLLAAMNRAGLLTIGSQPAVTAAAGFDGAVWDQRAWVDVLAVNGPLTDQLIGAASRNGLIVTVDTAETGHSQYCQVPVTRRDGVANTWAGGCWPELTTQWRDGGVRPELAGKLGALRLVALIDPAWGRPDRLWATITAALQGQE